MFKYLKQLLHDVVIQSQQYVGIGENRQREIGSVEEDRLEGARVGSELSSRLINASEIESRLHESSSSDRVAFVDPPELPIRLGAKSSWLESASPEKKIGQAEAVGKTVRAAHDHESDKVEIMLETTGEEDEEGKCRKGEMCGCENCSIVSEMSECGVCLEPLQTRGVRSCPLCANIVCSDCASRLKRCAFCRISLPMQKNRAIERLLGKLSLPCRNARSGCQKLLISETRLRHELSCDYASITCPLLGGSCHWQGSPTGILSHLKDVHDLKPLSSHGIAVEVSNFREKSIGKLGECTVYLTCYSQLFAIRVTTYRKKLNLTLFQLGYVGPGTEREASSKYGVWMRVKGAGKSIRGVLPFGKFDRETREVEINSETLFARRGTSSQVADTLNIEISIREIGGSSSR